ncbi:MAG: acyltransferase [Oscillospiraceae bacterium]|nr:acyltransferase [Oscillospiraceae bacterium]
MRQERIKWIDLLRALAILMVILCHATEGIYSLSISGLTDLSVQSKVSAFTLFTFGRLGVPIFLMISGYLLLDKEYDSEKTIKFWKNNWFQLFICTEVWFFIYEVFLKISGYEIGILQVVADLLFVHKVNMSHVWYMPMIVGMYLLIPFVANSLKHCDTKLLYFPILFFSVFSFCVPTGKAILNVLGLDALSLQMSLGFSGGIYGIYIVLGYMVKKEMLKFLKNAWLAIVAMVGIALSVILQLWSYKCGVQYNIWYDCVFLMVASVSIFELFSRITIVPAYSVVNWMSQYSFAVYLVHNMFRIPLKKYFLALNCAQMMKVLLLWGAVCILSFLTARLISLIPKIGKPLLYLK